MDNVTIIGMDPPVTKNCGWAVGRFVDDKVVLLEKFTQVLDPETRGLHVLDDVYQTLEGLIKKHEVSVLSIENSMGGGFAFGRAKLNEFVGVAKLCCARNMVKVVEVVPSHLKMNIAGHGRAPKKKIMANIVAAFELSDPGPEHECDAAGFVLNYCIDNGWQGYKVADPFTSAMLKAEKRAKAKRKKIKERKQREKLLKGEGNAPAV
jgi:Holliday junction resolvasome RuvABC endonuclease subunit